jgi:hypothetical protein
MFRWLKNMLLRSLVTQEEASLRMRLDECEKRLKVGLADLQFSRSRLEQLSDDLHRTAELMKELRIERDRLEAEKQVVDSQNELLWKANQRNIERIDAERAIVGRDIALAQIPRGAALEVE